MNLKFFFFDTSAICKLILSEPGSDTTRSFLGRTDNKIISSWVCIAETLGVLKRKLREKDSNGKVSLSSDEYTSAITALFHFIEDGTIKPIDVEGDGSQKLATYTAQVLRIRVKYPSLDAADAIQLAAISQSILNRIDKESRVKLVSADRGLLRAAELEGICIYSVIE